MDVAVFRAWLSGVVDLTAEQQQELDAVLTGRDGEAEVVAAIDACVREERQCPHCGTQGAVKRGRANGLRRYRCKACKKSFNALTGTPLARLPLKARLLDFTPSLSIGDTVRGAAAQCHVALTTALRWRHRFLKAVRTSTAPLRGIVEAEDTYLLDSRKGDRQLDRPARKRGGKAAKRALSRDQVPILVAADRSGSTVTAVLPAVSAIAIQAVLEPTVGPAVLLVTDGASYFPPAAIALGISHQALVQAAGERVRGELQIQMVNSRHQQIKGFLRAFRGIATKSLSNHLRWFHLIRLDPHPSPRSCLHAALGLQSLIPVPS